MWALCPKPSEPHKPQPDKPPERHRLEERGCFFRLLSFVALQHYSAMRRVGELKDFNDEVKGFVESNFELTYISRSIDSKVGD